MAVIAVRARRADHWWLRRRWELMGLYAVMRGWRGRIDATGRVCQRLLHGCCLAVRRRHAGRPCVAQPHSSAPLPAGATPWLFLARARALPARRDRIAAPTCRSGSGRNDWTVGPSLHDTGSGGVLPSSDTPGPIGKGRADGTEYEGGLDRYPWPGAGCGLLARVCGRSGWVVEPAPGVSDYKRYQRADATALHRRGDDGRDGLADRGHGDLDRLSVVSGEPGRRGASGHL